MSDLTRDQLAAAITRVREARAVPLAKYAVAADELAGELLAELAEMRAMTQGPWADAREHLCCAHAPDSLAAGELAAIDKIAAILAHRSQREAKRILAYVQDYATDDAVPPF